MKKLTCHCGAIEIKIKLNEKSNDYYRCNCSICKRKGSITTIVDKKDLEIEIERAHVWTPVTL